MRYRRRTNPAAGALLALAALLVPACLQAAEPGAPAARAAAAAVQQSQGPAPLRLGAADCSALLGSDFGTVPDAPIQLLEAAPVAARDALPAYCRVLGYVRSHVRFELRLPLERWNGKFMMEGCGGFCGTLDTARCDDRIARGYACIVTDMGHASTPFDGKWAYDDRDAEIDFGYRATHVTAVAGKAIAAAFYARPAAHSYFHGCSTGGRQGLMSAQRYPADFDGIIAGAPVLRMPMSSMVPTWALRALRDAQGRPLAGVAQIELLQRAVLQRCDARDGLADGILQDPRSCDFDPAMLACPAAPVAAATSTVPAAAVAGAAPAQCLSPPQVAAFRSIYAGPRDSQGHVLYPGPALGSEPGWIGTLASRDERPPLFEGFMTELFRYLAFFEDPGPAWRLEDFDFDRDPPRLGAMAQIFSAANPDLGEFRARGGKLIVYHGWGDAVVSPQATVDYYELAARTQGGLAALRDFARLYMIPGMGHCGGGDGAGAIDYLEALEAWRERDLAPDALIGMRPAAAGVAALRRPVYAYPTQAAYTGHGDGSEPRSFAPRDPSPRRGGIAH